MRKLITLKNLFNAWDEFKKGKRNKTDVMIFENNLEDNLFQLYHDLVANNYRHQSYETFSICDPKFRVINKAAVRDRIIHHLLYGYLEKIFQPQFIYHSYACQEGKGLHKAVVDLERSARKVSRNYTQNIWALKLDIKKFFASIDHEKLFGLIKRKVSDDVVLALLKIVIDSYFEPNTPARGLPIGNLTSQIFANIYLNELDYFIKFELRQKHYFRYADDFVILHRDRTHLLKLQNIISNFVSVKLRLQIHPQKVILRKLSQGIDFLGYVVLPHYCILRTRTRKRMFKKMARKTAEFNRGVIGDKKLNNSLQSYFGILKHCNGFEIEKMLRNYVWSRKIEVH